MSNYYKKQIERVADSETVTIKLAGVNDSTHHLTLNNESIPELIAFLLTRLDNVEQEEVI